ATNQYGTTDVIQEDLLYPVVGIPSYIFDTIPLPLSNLSNIEYSRELTTIGKESYQDALTYPNIIKTENFNFTNEHHVPPSYNKEDGGSYSDEIDFKNSPSLENFIQGWVYEEIHYT
ncbi:MAG: hypothetical protein P9M03_07845, partial [Candidatus Theseobacter exili]|nr:hypothetical protein [Candidatus Theseobacter exili]